ncbi:MAG TPA: hypothetical protein VFB38_22445 [Chthonomonadaceae bacterium]|nr:hypothetical protein [Chthonomonadaceae bacterium]
MRFLASLLTAAALAIVANPVAAKDKEADGPRVVAFVSYLDRHGVKLAHDKKIWWRVVKPKPTGYTLLVALRPFPQSATAAQMKAEAGQISLRFWLNTVAHLGMSLSMQTAKPELVRQGMEGPLNRRLLRLFDAYRPVPIGR